MVKKMLAWFSTHPWVGAAFCLGLMVGVVVCLPLVPYALPESSATLIGSAAGAVFAVWGAAWVSEQKERREVQAARDNVGGFVLQILERTVDAEGALVAIADGTQSPREIVPVAQRFWGGIEDARVRFPYVQPVFTKVGLDGVFAYAALINALKRLDDLPDHIFNLANDGSGKLTAMKSQVAKTQLRILREFRAELEKTMKIVNGVDFSVHSASHPQQEQPQDDVARPG